jgi:hypothetical protein
MPPPPPPSPRGVPGNAFYEYEWWTGDGGGVDVFEARLAGPYSDRTALDADVFGLLLVSACLVVVVVPAAARSLFCKTRCRVSTAAQ